MPCWSEAEIPLTGQMKASNSCKIKVLRILLINFKGADKAF